MRRMLYCWRCQKDVPMLAEHEREFVFPGDAGDQIERHIQVRGTGAERKSELYALKNHLHRAGSLERYYEITDFRETDVDALWHHSQLGPPCDKCGKPLRTKQAIFCAACGAHRG